MSSQNAIDQLQKKLLHHKYSKIYSKHQYNQLNRVIIAVLTLFKVRFNKFSKIRVKINQSTFQKSSHLRLLAVTHPQTNVLKYVNLPAPAEICRALTLSRRNVCHKNGKIDQNQHKIRGHKFLWRRLSDTRYRP